MFFPWDITRLEYDIGFVMADKYIYIYTYPILLPLRMTGVPDHPMFGASQG